MRFVWAAFFSDWPPDLQHAGAGHWAARMALGFELQVIGAVVLGGTDILAGRQLCGTVLGLSFFI